MPVAIWPPSLTAVQRPRRVEVRRPAGDRASRRGGALALLLPPLLLAAACEPVFVFAGGALGGTERPPPADWESSRGVHTMQIEARPEDPYSVNLWGVAIGTDFYVAASDAGESWWAQAIETDPRVRLRIGEDIYALSATRVTERRELDRVVDAYVAKYETGRDDSFVHTAWVYRLRPP